MGWRLTALVLLSALAATAWADGLATVAPLVAPQRAGAVTAPLGDLGPGLRTYLSFDHTLAGFDSQGREMDASFRRWSVAFLPDLTPVPMQTPRYLPGKFGEGVLIEYSGTWAGVNQFPAAIADAQAVPAAFRGLGDVSLAQATGTHGRPAMEVQANAGGAGFSTQPVTVPLANRAVFSLYLKGEARSVVSLSALKEGAEQPLGVQVVTLTGDWQRAWLAFPLSDKPVPQYTVGGPSSPLTFTVTAGAPGKFLAEALMLEISAGYGARQGVSTWMRGQTGRGDEIVTLRPPSNPQSGTLALWANLQGDMGMRSLLAVGYGNGWYPDLRLDLAHQQRLSVQLGSTLPGEKEPRGGAVNLPQPLAPNTWHHFAVTWDGPTVIVYLDGQPVLIVPNAPARPQLGGIAVGGVADWPLYKADAILDEFAQWDRALPSDQIAELFHHDHPLADGLDNSVTVRDEEPLAVFARDPGERQWPLRVSNRQSQPLSGARITYGVEGLFQQTVTLPNLPPGTAAEVALPWQPCLIRSGSYTMKITLQAGPLRRELSRPIEIVAARMPLDNAQVINWGGISPEFHEVGVTAGGLAGGPEGPTPHELEDCIRNGMYGQYRLHLVGEATTDADRFLDAAGHLGPADEASPAPRADAEAQAQFLASRLARLPDLRYLIENSEQQWIWAPDFRPETIAYVKQRFGLDLTSWQGPHLTSNDQVSLPMGRLNHEVGHYPAPASGIVPLQDPFYAYSRWWQSGEVGNEVYLNDLIARTVHAQAPWVQTIWEPTLRRPAVRVFQDQSLLEDWFYYPSPLAALWDEEGLAAATRGTHQRHTGMPQFLFKPGMAAPYAGMPTPDLYRETAWLCLSRPIVGLTYWNLGGALDQGEQQTQEEIERKIGPTPDWKTTAAKITVHGEDSGVFLWIPELKAEISRLHHEDLFPIGALVPRWQNRPRELAVYCSFAGQLLGEVRWPGGSPLNAVVGDLGQPFDVLYDQDFEGNPHLLDSYQMIVAPEDAAITQPAAGQLRAFLARGGKLIADDAWKANLPGVQQFEWSGTREDADALAQQEQDLLAQGLKPDSPAFLEAMGQASSQFQASGGPTARATAAILAGLSPQVTTPSRHVYFNLLQAGAANYVVAVNDLRIPGKYYGRFGRVLDQGVPQTVELSLDPALGQVAYALPQGTEVPLAEHAGRLLASLDLPAAGGRVLVLLPEKIAILTVTADSAHPARGSELRLSARLFGQSGQPVPGVIPLRVALTGPDGQALDYSRYAATVDGSWSLDLPVEWNAPAGAYRAEITDLASGQHQTPPVDCGVTAAPPLELAIAAEYRAFRR